jgi:hypothetical protein
MYKSGLLLLGRKKDAATDITGIVVTVATATTSIIVAMGITGGNTARGTKGANARHQRQPEPARRSNGGESSQDATPAEPARRLGAYEGQLRFRNKVNKRGTQVRQSKR